MTKNCYYSSVIFNDIYSSRNMHAEWRFGETWFIFEHGGRFLFTIESPKESTIADIRAKYHERRKEWEDEK